ncbi:MAG: isoleucine--tRNA ligase [Pseudomonadota bacterium]
MSNDYRKSVLLPKTEFPMRGNLPEREPKWLQKWQDENLWQKLREKRAGKKKFILHDGPPYANGHLHIGHALNKILKDIVNRTRQMMGYDAPYVPGWDCHGLPIEWKIEEQVRAEGLDRTSFKVNEFRAKCRAFASEWIEIQRKEFKRLGVMGDWDNPYQTMDFAAEAQIVRELGKFLTDGSLYRGKKPVLWSVVERTALAEAEIEYKPYRSTTLDVGFNVNQSSDADLIGASLVIWTTTPWTLPGNRAIAFHRSFTYGLYEILETDASSPLQQGTRLVVADALASAFAKRARLERGQWRRLRPVDANALEGALCAHPWASQGYDFAVPLHHAEFVDDASGTGLVHIGPGHGRDDYEFALTHGLEVPDTVAEDGSFMAHLPLVAGLQIYDDEGKKGNAEARIIEALKEAGVLYATQKLTHDYPHSWRSKTPLMFRNTAQWFVSMEKTDLRKKALCAIDATAFYPSQGRDRLHDMITTRPDWCVSRQRVWGVPLALFVDKTTGEPLRDQAVIDRIADAFCKGGCDVWFEGDPKRFLGDEHYPAQFEPVYDILDVWFDSGSTHAFVLEARDDLKRSEGEEDARPADLYLEGSDQHRGWFHSSLLVGCATRGRAPYKGVLTHGFVLAEDGQKMSKSLGNIVTPEAVIKQYGADILRLWVVASNYSEDLSIGPLTLKQHTESYRRLRNCLRWLLGNLPARAQVKSFAFEDLAEPERWMLHQLGTMNATVLAHARSYRLHRMFRAVHDFCANDLSAFYFDFRKDCLYCDSPDDPVREGVVFVLDQIFNHLVRWLAPILCFTAEEAWQIRHGPDHNSSVHLLDMPDDHEGWKDIALARRWEGWLAMRRTVLGAIEQARAEGVVGASLEAHVTLYCGHNEPLADADLLRLITITSGFEVVYQSPPDEAFKLAGQGDYGVMITHAKGRKCLRCWQILPDVGDHSDHPELCGRCVRVVEANPV